MVKKIIFLIIAVAIVLTVWLLFFNENDETRIKNQLSGLAECVSKRAGEKTSGMLLKSQMVSRYFDDKCELNIDDGNLVGHYTPEEISAQMVRIRKLFKEMSLDFYEAEISIPAEKEAVISFTGHLTGTVKDGKRVNEVRELQAKLKKKNNKWRFYSFEVKEVLKK